MEKKCDAVFEGGGVRGIGLVGAVAAVEKAGYTFENLAGTSAGAIVASLLAVGYKAPEIEEILSNLDYRDFEDETFMSNLGWPGKLISEFLSYGAYKGDFFENWLADLLKAKGKTTFGDIRYGDDTLDEKYRYKFQAIAADLTDRRLLVLPGDLREFGLEPDEFSIVAAVRMSMSIPLFFTPVQLSDSEDTVHYIVDGGVLSNYPIWLLDDGTSNPPWPTFGFKLVEADPRSWPAIDPSINNVFDYLPALMGTLLDGHDNYHISTSRGDFDRTIRIPTTIYLKGRERKIGTVDFDIKPEESKALFENGWNAGQSFLESWNFHEWKKTYREKKG